MTTPTDVLALPNALILLLGAAGTGKTRTSRMFHPDSVLRADDFRALCAGDPGSQQANSDVWDVLESTLTIRLRLGLKTVVDATNSAAAHRARLVAAGRTHGAPVVALLLGPGLSVAQQRNAARPGNRRVPADIVAEQYAQVVAAHPRLEQEGFDHVVFAESLPVLGTALERLTAEEEKTEATADVRRVFGHAAADLFDWDAPGSGPYRTGAFAAAGESLAVRWVDDGDPFDHRFEARVSCPTEWCPGPAWTPVRSMADLAAAHRNTPHDETECERCDT